MSAKVENIEAPKVEIKTVGYVALNTGNGHIYTQKNNKRRAERAKAEKDAKRKEEADIARKLERLRGRKDWTREQRNCKRKGA